MSNIVNVRAVDPGLSERVVKVVGEVRALSVYTYRAILLAAVALGIYATFSHDLKMVGIVVVAVVLFCVAGICMNVLEAIFLKPVRNIRFGRAAKSLRSEIFATTGNETFAWHWWDAAPGALGITRSGHLVVANESTNFQQATLTSHQIVDVSVERKVTVVTDTKESGGVHVGGVFGGVIGGVSSGRTSKSVSTTHEQAFVEIRYQLSANSPVGTIVVPFHTDRRSAQECCGMIRRMTTQAELAVA